MTTQKTHEEKHPMTDADVKRKAVKLVVAHMRKKVTTEYLGIEYLAGWLDEIEALLEREDFEIREYHHMRKELNEVIESTLDEEMRNRLRNSWLSMGKALDKKTSPY
jgi:hypothetical protein